MIDWENLLVQLFVLAIFGIVYAWIGGKVGFKAGVGAAKKELFDLIGINPDQWKKLTKDRRRKLLIEQLSKAMQETIDLLSTDKQVKKVSENLVAYVKALPEYKEAMEVFRDLKKLAENVTEELNAETERQKKKHAQT